MKRLIFRMLALTVDLLILNIILFAISNISFINTHIQDIQVTSNLFKEIQTEYNGLNNRINDMLSDGVIDVGEGTELKHNYPFFYKVVATIPVDQQLDDNQKNDIRNSIDNQYSRGLYAYNYDISKYNIKTNIIGIVISILYFGVFEWFKHGKTIGKMIFRLRTVDNKDSKKKIPLWKYIIKAFLISGVLFTIANIVITLICTGSQDGNFNLTWFNAGFNTIYNIQYMYNVLFLLFIFIRRDERSVHDVLLGIKVNLYDKNKNVVDSRIFNEEVNNKTN